MTPGNRRYRVLVSVMVPATAWRTVEAESEDDALKQVRDDIGGRGWESLTWAGGDGNTSEWDSSDNWQNAHSVEVAGDMVEEVDP